MTTHTAHIARPVRRTHRPFALPRIYFHMEIPIEIHRKDLWVSAFIFLAGLALPALMVFGILEPGFFLGFVGFALTFLGGVLLLVRWGEIA